IFVSAESNAPWRFVSNTIFQWKTAASYWWQRMSKNSNACTLSMIAAYKIRSTLKSLMQFS
ncbi:FAD dependent oxidoreductase family protein, partial [Vibrio cholerae HC-41B1]